MQDRLVNSVPTYWGVRIREAGVGLTRTIAEENDRREPRRPRRRSAERAPEWLGVARPTVP